MLLPISRHVSVTSLILLAVTLLDAYTPNGSWFYPHWFEMAQHGLLSSLSFPSAVLSDGVCSFASPVVSGRLHWMSTRWFIELAEEVQNRKWVGISPNMVHLVHSSHDKKC
jgi:hypothetical protein